MRNEASRAALVFFAALITAACEDAHRIAGPSPRIPPPSAARIAASSIADLGLGDGTYGLLINNNGQIVAEERPSDGVSPPRAFLWSGGTTRNYLTGLGASPAAMNDAGQIVGGVWSGLSWSAALWNDPATPTVLSTAASFAYGINEHGEVTGMLTVDGPFPGKQAGFLFSPALGMIPVFTSDWSSIGGYPGVAAAKDVNDLGQIVGYHGVAPNGRQHALVWTSSGGVTDLGTVSGLENDYSQADRINNRGVIIGWSTDSRMPTIPHRAVLWSSPEQISDLGTLGGTTAAATDINDLNQVVGSSQRADGTTHAFVWTAETGMLDLGTLGGSNSSASGINDRGEIIGSSTTSSGAWRAVRWTLTMAPTTPNEVLIALSAAVDKLGTEGVLTSGNAQALRAKLDAAARQLNRGSAVVAVNILGAFINQVQAYEKAGALSAVQAKQLIDSAQEAITLLSN